MRDGPVDTIQRPAADIGTPIKERLLTRSQHFTPNISRPLQPGENGMKVQHDSATPPPENKQQFDTVSTRPRQGIDRNRANNKNAPCTNLYHPPPLHLLRSKSSPPTTKGLRDPITQERQLLRTRMDVNVLDKPSGKRRLRAGTTTEDFTSRSRSKPSDMQWNAARDEDESTSKTTASSESPNQQAKEAQSATERQSFRDAGQLPATMLPALGVKDGLTAKKDGYHFTACVPATENRREKANGADTSQLLAQMTSVLREINRLRIENEQLSARTEQLSVHSRRLESKLARVENGLDGLHKKQSGSKSFEKLGSKLF